MLFFKKLLYLFRDLNLNITILTFFASLIGHFMITAINPFPERTREELTHKKTNGIASLGGIVFVSVFILVTSSYLNIAIFSTGMFLIFGIFLSLYNNQDYFFISWLKKGQIFKKRDIFVILAIKSLVLIYVNWSNFDKQILLNLTVFQSLVVGMMDDLQKKITGEGFSEKKLFSFQLIIATIFAFWAIVNKYTSLKIMNISLDFGFFYWFFFLFFFTSVVNSSNLTDGFNGGLASITISICLFFLVHCGHSAFSYKINHLVPIFDPFFINNIVIFIFALFPFLIFNIKGKLMMGNGGSMAIGTFLAAMALFMKTELLMPLYGIVLLMETLSVIIQRFSFQKYGKRIFLFTPIHHHFEKLGWDNSKILLVFNALCLLGSFLAFWFL